MKKVFSPRNASAVIRAERGSAVGRRAFARAFLTASFTQPSAVAAPLAD